MEKLAAVLDAQPMQGIDLGTATQTLHQPQSDAGGSAEVAIVRAEAVRLLQAIGQLGAMPAPSNSRRARVMAAPAKADRQAAAVSVWAPQMISEYSAATERGLDSAVDDRSYVGYDSAKFVVDEWQGIRVETGTQQVSAILTGHFRYREHGVGWTDAPQKQHQLFMVWADPGRRQLRIVGWMSLPLLPGAAS